MAKHLKILTSQYLNEYSEKVNIDWFAVFNKLKNKETYSKEDFEFYIKSAATFSSNIEGNSIDIDTYLKNKTFKIKSKPKEMAEIDDLISAYNFAIKNKLNQANFLKSHEKLSRTVLEVKSQRGKLRKQQVGIFSDGKVEYMAVEPEHVKEEFSKLFADIKELLSRELSYKETFYYAAFIHLMFEKIHPFTDGNGRAGRLLEKWFLAQKIGKNTWSIPSEKYYAKNRQEYYKKIHIGYNYYALKLERAVEFLLLLPKALK
ncbi:MAG: Fic family protein [Bacteroidetes bacterium]|nr:Fic family protein [Bacteroidota bacterium]